VTERLPAQLEAELRGLRADLPQVSSSQLIRHARAAALLISWCRRALAQGHLVTTAAALRTTLGLRRAELETLRIPVDLLDLFPRWRAGSRDAFQPPRRRASLVPAASTIPLGPVRVVLAPAAGAAALMLPLLRGLAARLDRDAPITVMVDPGKTANELRRIVEQVLGNSRRIRFEVGRAATMFARDHALAGRGPTGDPLLLIPRGFRPDRGKEDVALDEHAAPRALGGAVQRAPCLDPAVSRAG